MARGVSLDLGHGVAFAPSELGAQVWGAGEGPVRGPCTPHLGPCTPKQHTQATALQHKRLWCSLDPERGAKRPSHPSQCPPGVPQPGKPPTTIWRDCWFAQRRRTQDASSPTAPRAPQALPCTQKACSPLPGLSGGREGGWRARRHVMGPGVGNQGLPEALGGSVGGGRMGVRRPESHGCKGSGPPEPRLWRAWLLSQRLQGDLGEIRSRWRRRPRGGGPKIAS